MNIIQFRSISVSFGCMYFFIFQSLDITASFLTSHRLNTKICTHRASQMEWKCGKCLKSTIFEGKLQVFISYLSEMKMVSMYYNSFLFQYFLQLVTTIFLFWRYLQMIWIAMCEWQLWASIPCQIKSDVSKLSYWDIRDMKNAKQEEQVVVGKWVKQYQAKTWKA